MKPIILLDIDGVLNPVAGPVDGTDRPKLTLPPQKTALVRKLAALGRIAWVSTWPADLVGGIEAQLNLEVQPLRAVMVLRPDDDDQPTPKLRSVTTWLARMEALGEADWDSVVWIDDVLGADAREWAHSYTRPVLLEKPTADVGLAEVHVVAVAVFVDSVAAG
ncbi:HAD domain-containing protein [Pseudarthrobacter sp. YS3]|uniref:HAD domain-containing protein n=1 Tax=Pseudarthrobacter sp. YS3 TaxID=3453718 RepID=UPI003EEEAC4D